MATAACAMCDAHVAEVVLNDSERKKTDNMGSTVLDNFNRLKSGNDSERLDAGVALLQYLCQQNTDQDDNKELNYMLIRLVRGLGSTTLFAKKGFYATLTASLMMRPEMSIEKLLSVMNNQLHPAGNNSKSENAEIYMGRILLCGAFIRSKLLAQSPLKLQQQIIEILLNAGRQRSYLSFISVIFLREFIVDLNTKSIEKSVWPIIAKELGKPWSEQTLDTLYLLLVIRYEHPSLVDEKFLTEHLGVKDIIVDESMEDIVKILTNLPRIVFCRHPVFKLFCEKLTSTELLVNFWAGIDQKFTKPSKGNEYIAVEMLRSILTNVTDKTVIPSLLSPNLLRHMLKRFSNCKKNNNDEVLIALKEVLHLIASATNDTDIKTKTQLNILKKLLLDPGDLMIEKKTGTKVIQTITGHLKSDGVKKLCELYRDIIENKVKKRKDVKGDLWTNAERSYAAQLLTRLMAHPVIVSDQDWRLEQLTFLFNYGLCEVPNVGIDLAPQFKDSFYRALDYKLPKLDDVRSLLSSLVHDLNVKLRSNAIQLRSPLNKATSDAWNKVIGLIDKLEKTKRNAEALPIFHTMNLHMGLQLFSDPEMAIMSIDELQCCYERLTKKLESHAKADMTTKEEPHWVEVVVDLLLSLLSRNNHLLRSLVGCVFPHICPYLTPTAVYHILTVLDVKNNQNALSAKDESDEDSSDIEENESDSDNDDDNDVDDAEDTISNDEASSNEEQSNSDSEMLDGDETLTDKLRVAVRQALGDAANRTDDEDIDVDDIDDDEGRRLDESLAVAFRILRENRQARAKKQEKSDQTLTHFRVRVVDLLDIYLETCPSLAVTLDMIVPLFSLLEFCVKDPHQKPLEHRVRSCLKKLSSVKKFKDTTGVECDSLTTVLKVLIEKGERSSSVHHEINDKLAECCTFLVRCVQQANLPTESIVGIYVENLTSFFKKRDCVLSFALFKGVLQLCWEGNWQLASVLVDSAFDSDVRYFRRSQALELLLIFYNNNRLLRMDTKYAKTRITLETALYENTVRTFEELCDPRTNENGQCSVTEKIQQRKVQQKFVGLLLTLLRVVHLHHLQQVWDWLKVKTTVTTYRNRSVFSKDVKSAYNKLAIQIGAPINASSVNNTALCNNSTDVAVYSNGKQNNVGSQKEPMINGTSDSEEEIRHSDNAQSKKKKKKNKSKQRDKQASKKEARELRLQAMSKDLTPFNFSSVNLPANQMNAMDIQNGNSHDDEFACSKLTQKRNYDKTAEDDGTVKKRKKKRRKGSINCS